MQMNFKMKLFFLFTALLAVAQFQTHASELGGAVSFSQPNFYGLIDIGGYQRGRQTSITKKCFEDGGHASHQSANCTTVATTPAPRQASSNNIGLIDPRSCWCRGTASG